MQVSAVPVRHPADVRTRSRNRHLGTVGPVHGPRHTAAPPMLLGASHEEMHQIQTNVTWPNHQNSKRPRITKDAAGAATPPMAVALPLLTRRVIGPRIVCTPPLPDSFAVVSESALRAPTLRRAFSQAIVDMASRRSADSRASATAASHSGPRPSSSVVVVSSSNEVLLLHRVDTGSSFPSAHVFPGGNLDAFHDGEIPAADTPERHQDGLPYRLGAIRECFEESGILLARKDGALVSLSEEERDGAREKIHNREISFPDFLHSVGAVADTGSFSP